MPQTAMFIDSMRKAFGNDVIDAQLRLAMKGKPTFYAEENGHTFGTKLINEGVEISLADIVINIENKNTSVDINARRK